MALQLTGKISLDGSGFEAGAKRVMGVVSGLKGMIATAFGTFAITNIVRSTIEWASSLRDVSDNLGVNVEFLQKLQNGAKMAGADLEEVARLINEVNKSRQEAMRQPGGKAAQAFGRLGFTGGDITGLSTQAFVEKLIGAFKSGASTQAVVDLQEVGGKSARVLTAAFLSQFQSDAPILSEDMVDQLDVIGDQFTLLSQILKVQVAPAIIAVADAAVGLIQRLRESFAFFKEASVPVIERIVRMVAGVQGGKKPPSPGAALVNIFAGIAEGFNRGGKAALSEEDKFKEAMAAIVSGQAGAREARHRREGAAPGFEPLAAAGRGRGARSEAGDALVRVGNFLGSTPSTINGIQQQVQLQRESLTVLKQIQVAVATATAQMRLLQTAFPMF